MDSPAGSRGAGFDTARLRGSLAILSAAIVAALGKPLISVILFISGVRFLLVACVQFGAGAMVGAASGTLGLRTAALI